MNHERNEKSSEFLERLEKIKKEPFEFKQPMKRKHLIERLKSISTALHKILTELESIINNLETPELEEEIIKEYIKSLRKKNFTPLKEKKTLSPFRSVAPHLKIPKDTE